MRDHIVEKRRVSSGKRIIKLLAGGVTNTSSEPSLVSSVTDADVTKVSSTLCRCENINGFCRGGMVKALSLIVKEEK